MRPLFTVHAGEFLVGEFIEREFRSLNVWIPSKDTGVDLLVTDEHLRAKPISLQVKLSRDYTQPEAVDALDRDAVAGGWLVISHQKLETSTASYWVIVVVSHVRKSQPEYIIIPPRELLSKLVEIHGVSKNYHFYPWITKSGQCLQGRGVAKGDRDAIAAGTFPLGARDLRPYRNNWKFLEELQHSL